MTNSVVSEQRLNNGISTEAQGIRAYHEDNAPVGIRVRPIESRSHSQMIGLEMYKVTAHLKIMFMEIGAMLMTMILYDLLKKGINGITWEVLSQPLHDRTSLNMYVKGARP